MSAFAGMTMSVDLILQQYLKSSLAAAFWEMDK
jgi:hypothetical protein